MAREKEFQQTKTDIEPFTAGCPINLKRKIKGKGQLRDILSREVGDVLDKEIENQEKLVKKIQKWQKQFRGIKKEKVFPYPKASNIAIPLTRWLIETVFVRVIDAIFSQQKVWTCRAKKPEWVDIAPHIEDALDWWQKRIAKLRKTISSPLLQAMKMGTGLLNLSYDRIKRTVYKRADETEKANKEITKYADTDGNQMVKVPDTVYEGPGLKTISLEDWIISSDSTSLQDAFLAGFRTYLRIPQFEVRAKNRFYDVPDDKLERIIKGDVLDETKVERIKESHKEVDEEDRTRIEIWELWLKYDVDDDGEEDDIVITFHQETRTILRAMYNPYFYGFRPFQEIVFDPTEYSFYGVGGCEKLEQLQEVEDTLWNQRIDKANQFNAPVYLRDSTQISENFETIYPGIIIDVLDIEKAVKVLEYPGAYPDTAPLEALINHYAQLVIGVSPHVMGQPTAERPVARETLVLIQELNKKYKYYIDNGRTFFNELGMRVVEMIAQFQPRYEYKVEDKGVFETRIVEFPPDLIRDGIEIDLMASSEVMNTEIRREINMTLYQIINDYSTKLYGMATALNNEYTPQPLKQLIVNVAEIGAKVMKRILRDFQCIDAEDLVPDLEKNMPAREIAQRPAKPPPPPEVQGGEERRQPGA